MINPVLLEATSLTSFIIGLMNYDENLKQTTNDELKDMLNEQTRELLLEIRKAQVLIVENQTLILKKLEGINIEG